jgi:hypothetical protein
MNTGYLNICTLMHTTCVCAIYRYTLHSSVLDIIKQDDRICLLGIMWFYRKQSTNWKYFEMCSSNEHIKSLCKDLGSTIVLQMDNLKISRLKIAAKYLKCENRLSEIENLYLSV